MSQHDFDIAKTDANTGASFRSEVNTALQALASNSKGTTEPAIKYPYQKWADDTTGYMRLRNGANTAWINLYKLEGSAGGLFSPIAGPGSSQAFSVGALSATGASHIFCAPDVNTGDSNITSYASGAWFIAKTTNAGKYGGLKVVDVNNNDIFSITTEGSSGAAQLKIAGTERLRVATTGSLLIGTTTDDGVNKLQVNGGIKAVGAMTVATLIASGTPAGAYGANRWMIQNEGNNGCRSYACGADSTSYGTWTHYTAKSTGDPIAVLTVSSAGVNINALAGHGTGYVKVDNNGTLYWSAT